jgi:peptidoglycan/LPS O-acetylase OafA/YrhL
MGLLRVILALAVVLEHTGGFFNFRLCGGELAVQLFYVISGFYMSLVLNERYLFGNNMVFWSARVARLLPVYWAAIILALLVQMVIYQTTGHGFFHYAAAALHTLSAPQLFHVAASNLVIFGMDWGNFMGPIVLDGETVRRLSLWVIPQSWTIGIELSFYLVAPFIVRRGVKSILAVLAASLLLRLVLWRTIGVPDFQWRYGFFPSELALFMLGALAYQLYVRLKTVTIAPWMKYFAVAFIGFAALFQPIKDGLRLVIGSPAAGLTLVILVLAVPAIAILFHLTKKNKLDQKIGEFSYPVYLVHFMFVQLYAALVGTATDPAASAMRTLTCLPVTLIAAWVLVYGVERKVDEVRARWTNRKLHASAKKGPLPVPPRW